MSRLVSIGRAAGAVGITLGVAAAGAAVGFAAERYAVGRSLRGDDPYVDEPLGTLRGEVYRVVTDDGISLHVEVDEPGGRDDLTVVFAHGYALNLDEWHFQRRDLRGTARLLFWDHRSHGRSAPAEPESLSFERLAFDLGQVIDEVAPKGQIVLVGHSMGGMTVMALTAVRPDLFANRVAGVALITTSHRDLATTPLGVPGAPGRLARRMAPGVVAALARQPDLIERGRRAGSDLGYVLTRRYSFSDDGSPSLVRYTAQMNAETPIDVVAAFLPLFSTNDQHASLEVLSGLPVLVIGAADDRLTPVEHSRALAEVLPEADYIEIPDTGHMVLLERHETVTENLQKLVERVRDARRGRLLRRWRAR